MMVARTQRERLPHGLSLPDKQPASSTGFAAATMNGRETSPNPHWRLFDGSRESTAIWNYAIVHALVLNSARYLQEIKPHKSN